MALLFVYRLFPIITFFFLLYSSLFEKILLFDSLLKNNPLKKERKVSL
ncbi:hypothetical protein HMPREF3187_00178 [Aerococcus christensenii]|uniref:Uncharacterized protein n=1 Tax=Aerococcus christensenii TaxID=87541 RepID=A0A133Y4D2_9LACT|nr:hypothetical protein HMPREF3187_00178 [Aerococcus christensenii]